MSDSFSAPKGLIVVAALFHDTKSSGKKVLVRGGDHKLPEGVLTAREVESFPPHQDFSLVIPKERAEPGTQNDFPLTVHYKIGLSVHGNPWSVTQDFWTKRKEDFIKSFLGRLKSMHKDGTFIFHLIEEGKLVNAANLARRDEANAAAQGSFFPIRVFGVSSGPHLALDPFDDPE